jgi:hypothetical protein
MGADAIDREERQRRELEEIRRSFTEIGTRMGSVFEPAPPEKEEGEQPEPEEVRALLPPPPAERQAPRWTVPAVMALVCLLAGGGLGYLLHSPAPLQPPTSTVITSVVPRPKLVSPPACIETARRGDEAIDLLIRNIRDRRLSSALKAYTEASQACRKEASP